MKSEVHPIRYISSNIFGLAIFILFSIVVELFLYIRLRPYFGNYPCIVCGNPDAKPVKSLWIYKPGPVPSVKEVEIWYCKKHIEKAKEIVDRKHDTGDTVRNRYIHLSIFCLMLFAMVLVTAVIFNISAFYGVSAHLSLALIWLFTDPISRISMNLAIVLIPGLPGIMYLLWKIGIKQEQKRFQRERRT
ncbi:MAG: hypothetical protein DRP91_09650 [Candidatus Neomarinimicrobiota bacterium]|nr:hypothetical protein [Candidatus Neomarinimicrobiota bacterium]RKY45730.1 MAG: hypothetical protein DRP91_09650 [Candidatus Neomarinimicrobiota bacterium]